MAASSSIGCSSLRRIHIFCSSSGLGQQLFLARAGAIDVDGREDALLGDPAIQVHLHVAGALEFLEDHVVHPRAGIDQRRGDDGQAAAFLDIARGAEETLGPLQRVGIDTAGQHLARGRHDRVVGARQARDRIEQDDHVALVLDQALGLLDHHLRDLDVAAGRLVEGAGDDFAAHRARHLGDFLGTLVDQQHDQVALRMVGRDRRGDVLQQHRLAGLRRRHDQAALAFADRRDQIDDAGGQILGAAVAALELEALGREQRRQILEQDLVRGVLRRVEIDLADLEQREVALAVLRRPDQARDGVAGAQIEAADLAGRDIDVVGAGQIRTVGRTQEAEAVLQNLEHAVAIDVLAVARVRLEDREDDVLLARASQVLQPHGRAQLDQLRHRLLLELGEVHGLFASSQILFGNDLEFLQIRKFLRVLLAAPRLLVAGTAAPLSLTLFVAASAGRIITQVASHRFSSKNSESCPFDTAPTFWASTVPFLNSMSVGIPRMPNFGGVSGFSSILILATRTLPW